jgi:hypothetical protein
MEAVFEEPSTEAEFAAAANPDAPKTETERRVVETFNALERAESEFNPGVEFGKAVIELRKEIKATGRGKWMERLNQLGITYAKARYWIAVVEGEPINRGKVADAEKPAWDWNAALAKLEQLVDQVEMLKRGDPDGSMVLDKPLEQLAEILGWRLVEKEGADA